MSAVPLIRGAALVAVAAMTLAACSSTEDDATALDIAAATSADASPEASETATEVTEVTEVTVQTYQGEATVPANPQTVVVFEHGILDTIDALGAGDAVAGVPHHAVPSYLTDYTTSTENMGTLFEPDYEAVNALQPDLIIVGGRSAATLPEMEKIAPTIDLSFDWEADAFETSLQTNTTTLGTIFGKDAEAAAALESLSTQAADINTAAADAGKGLVVMTSAGEVSAYGPGSRFDFVYNLLGIDPAAEQVAIDDHGDAISFEFIAETNPDVLLVLDRDAAIGEEADSAQTVLDNDLVNGTNAVTNDKVAYVDTEKWYLSFGGLTALQGILDDVNSVVS
ncbi:siderophore ABC transporter substrate-binding protein [Demequina aurantiaca]|uniref:siderophore ABC transporter substrate-binding protein n=1 Tax=Demequina aurantiaca TaxID=676200 RepID=UPI000B18A7BD|nr:ABC transporter substrate-binding protein [Demequina aurantiaca]